MRLPLVCLLPEHAYESMPETWTYQRALQAIVCAGLLAEMPHFCACCREVWYLSLSTYRSEDENLFKISRKVIC
jgi:uncharacterized membrane protein